MAAVLAEQGPVLKTKWNLNAPGDVRRIARRLRPRHWAAVYELASYRPGYIASSCRTVHPTIGIITNIGLAHAGLLGGIRGVARDKGALVRSLPRNGVAILNADDPGTRLLNFGRFRGRVVRYGLRPTAQVWASDIRYDGDGMHFTAHRGEEAVELRIAALGEHNVANALAVFAAARELGMSAEKIQRGLRKFTLARSRMKVCHAGGVLLLDDSYNANPHSMAAGIRVLRQAGEGRRVAVVGGMSTLGHWARDAHLELGRQLAVDDINEVVLVGRMARIIAEGIELARRGAARREGGGSRVTIVRTPEAAAQHLKDSLQAPAVVWLKGSNNAHLGRAFRLLVEALGVPQPDERGLNQVRSS